MNLYLNILKEILNYDIYIKYNNYINYIYIKENLPEIYKLYKTNELIKTRDNNNLSIDDLELHFYKEYPLASQQLFQPLFKDLRETQGAQETIIEYLDSAYKRQKAIDIARSAIEYSEGKIQDSDFRKTIEESFLPSEITSPLCDQDFVTDDLQELFNLNQKEPGLKWRLTQLNQSLGSLRRGDFGFIFARPETGKTTLLASEITMLASQLQDRPAIWFNNEERGSKVMTRVFQGALGLNLSQLYSDIPGNKVKFNELIKGNFKLVDDASLTRTKIESICQKYNPGLIIFDQIDKIKGFEGDRHDLLLKAIYQWAREMAKVYGPVIGICQAGSSGEGKKWLTMDDVDSSHTAKQGEADWILGIGKTHDEETEYVRYFHLCKNKLADGLETIPELRHGRFTTRIKPDIARYED